MIFEIVKFEKFVKFFFQFEKPKFDSKNWQISIVFVPSIFRSIRNFPKFLEFGKLGNFPNCYD